MVAEAMFEANRLLLLLYDCKTKHKNIFQFYGKTIKNGIGSLPFTAFCFFYMLLFTFSLTVA
tara:strand:- start:436 stop:621 length:186 start_codon:yes stop_codon:yes gene_type:complete